MTGFDRMLYDKLSYLRLGGHFFALFGAANLALYGASLFMTKEQYNYHFSYNGVVPRMFTPFKAMAAADTLSNVIWTAPTLIGLNYYMMSRVGPLVMTKFFALTLASTFIFWSAFNPTTGLNYRLLKHFPVKFDSFADDGSYYRGAD